MTETTPALRDDQGEITGVIDHSRYVEYTDRELLENIADAVNMLADAASLMAENMGPILGNPMVSMALKTIAKFRI